MVFEGLVSSSVLIVICASLFYYFGFLLDPNKGLGTESGKYVAGFIFVIFHIFWPAAVFFICYYQLHWGVLYDFINHYLAISFFRNFNFDAFSYLLVMLIQFSVVIVLTSWCNAFNSFSMVADRNYSASKIFVKKIPERNFRLLSWSMVFSRSILCCK